MNLDIKICQVYNLFYCRANEKTVRGSGCNQPMDAKVLVPILLLYVTGKFLLRQIEPVPQDQIKFFFHLYVKTVELCCIPKIKCEYHAAASKVNYGDGTNFDKELWKFSSAEYELFKKAKLREECSDFLKKNIDLLLSRCCGVQSPKEGLLLI